MAELRTASFALGGGSKFITRHRPWNSIPEFKLTRQVEGGFISWGKATKKLVDFDSEDMITTGLLFG